MERTLGGKSDHTEMLRFLEDLRDNKRRAKRRPKVARKVKARRARKRA
jgi:hypothetical protein